MTARYRLGTTCRRTGVRSFPRMFRLDPQHPAAAREDAWSTALAGRRDSNVPAPYFIAEEEVPRAGRTVTRSFQRARWTNGSTFLWIGRSSPVGRGEGSSGLVFDQIDEVRAP